MTDPPPKDDEIQRLEEALLRLRNENAQWRRKVEAAQVVIRRRATNADGLSLKAALKTILDDRDKNLDRIDFFRNKLKKILKMLVDGKESDAKKELNVFLYKNPR